MLRAWCAKQEERTYFTLTLKMIIRSLKILTWRMEISIFLFIEPTKPWIMGINYVKKYIIKMCIKHLFIFIGKVDLQRREIERCCIPRFTPTVELSRSEGRRMCTSLVLSVSSIWKAKPPYQTVSADTLILDFPTSQLWEINICSL